MCQALTRAIGTDAAETTIAARSTIQGRVSGVCQRGSVRDQPIANNHAVKTASEIASRLLTDCQGRRSSGSRCSNGARERQHARARTCRCRHERTVARHGPGEHGGSSATVEAEGSRN